MNPDAPTRAAGGENISRREALKRTLLLAGLAVTPAVIERAAAAQAAVASPGRARNLSPQQFAAVAAMAERILPKTDTAGAIDAGVPEFIDVMAGGYMTADERRSFASGLGDVDAVCARMHGSPFGRLAAGTQDAVMRQLATSGTDEQRAFFRRIRELTIIGYFTSEHVGKHVTGYDPVPGRFDACVPIQETGARSWTR